MIKNVKTIAAGNLSLVILILLFLILSTGCTTKPDVDQLKGELESKLQKYRGNTSTGNADIYKIISLEKTNGISNDKRYELEYKGEVKCIKAFYAYPDGSYALDNPRRGFKEYIYKGKAFSFTGTMTYRLTEKGWKSIANSTRMSPSYAPPLFKEVALENR